MTGYDGGGNNDNEDWLISPVFDLSGKISATLSFSHALNYCADENAKRNQQSLWYSTDYVGGAPNEATWSQLHIPNMPSGNNWTFVNSGNIIFPAEALSSNVHFAFKYTSNASVAGTWEINNLLFSAECPPVAGVSSTAISANSKVYSSDKTIIIENQAAQFVSVFDIMGRELFLGNKVLNVNVPIEQSGIYFVKSGTEVYKIIVK
jgi:hypothetical protein